MRRLVTLVTFVASATLSLAACTDRSDPIAPPAARSAGLIPNFPKKDPYRLVQVSAGAYHTCVLRGVGRLWCWGRSNAGQVGAGTATATCSSGYHCFPLPAEVGVDSSRGFYECCFTPVKAVTVGYDHTCTISSGGAAWCWGDNSAYQLGLMSGGGSFSRPVSVADRIAYESLSASYHNTCGTSGGFVFCWGGSGQGAGTRYVGGPVYDSFSAISVNWDHTCMMGTSSTQGARPYCWGANGSGQSGAYPTSGWSSTVAPFGATPIGYGQASRVSSGDGFTCADMTDGTVACFGGNGFGQLGDPGFTGSFSASLIRVGGGKRLHGVAAGDHHACALDDTNAAWCWGLNVYDELGAPGGGPYSVTGTRTPVQVPGGHAFASLSAGLYHTCGIGTDGLLWCWGENYDGQLGTNAYLPGQHTATPVQALVP